MRVSVIELLTFCLVIITGVYAYLTLRLVETSRASVAAMKAQLEATTRPYVLFDLELHGNLVEASLRNTGVTAARQVTITIAPPLQVAVAAEIRPFQLAETPLTLLAPTRELREYIGRREHVRSLSADLRFSVSIRYEDAAGSVYDEHFAIDLSGLFEMAYIARPTSAKELQKISDTLKEIQRSLERAARDEEV